MTRVAPVLLIGFIALLGFIYLLVSNRQTKRRESDALLRAHVLSVEGLIGDILTIARQNRDIDPSAELIIMAINDHTKKELNL
ncbi:MAG: hypothetical protein RLZZ403_1750 [Pseudomonadota bacterium]|jgi:preprotein translocase subunit YajC